MDDDKTKSEDLDSTETVQPQSPVLPERVGPYRILELLGEGGRPYFAMEHVKGVPITEHCDRQRLTTRERLELFRQVCEGVQHSHQKAIIHRDLKPSNVLVTLQDGKPVPKIIDFGIAKATTAPLTDHTLHTEIGRLMGTPEYMSPEQAGTSALGLSQTPVLSAFK